MPKEFHYKLQQYYSAIGRVLKGEADTASIFPNSTDVGMSRERVYLEVLKRHLPSSCNVRQGGFLFDIEGNESQQIDVIVNNDKSIRFDFNNPDGSGKSFSCIEGCVAVASIKSTLDSRRLKDSLLNLSSLPDKAPLNGRQNPRVRISNYDDWPFKIVFAFDGVSSEITYTTLESFYAENSNIPIFKRPNIIHVAGKYVITRVGGQGGTTIDGTQLEPNSYQLLLSHPDEYGIPFVIASIQEIAAASDHVIYNYGELINKLPLD